MNPKVTEFIQKADSWQSEMELLRNIVLECGLTEELKWKQPCYLYHDANMIMIGRFKDYVTLSFFKGQLLNDSEDILVSPGKNSQSVKMAKFINIKQIIAVKPILKAYIYEAIEIEKVGLKVEKKLSTNLEYSDELKEIFNNNSEFKAAFEALTPGRQRGYNIFFTTAKQSKTRISRIETYKDRIMNGIGMNDCVCGHSKRMPSCDGSHKYL